MHTQPYVPTPEHKTALEMYGRLLKLFQENDIELADCEYPDRKYADALFTSTETDDGRYSVELILEKPQPAKGRLDDVLSEVSLMIFDSESNLLWALSVAYQGGNASEPWYLHMQQEDHYEGRRPVTFLKNAVDGNCAEDVALRQVQLLIGFYKSI